MAAEAREAPDDPARAAEDAPLPAPPLPPEIDFLRHFGVDRAELGAAAARAAASGVTADRALLAAGILSAELFYRHLADHLGVGFLHHPLRVAEGVAIEGVTEVEIVPLAPNSSGVDFALAPRGPTLARLLARFAPDSAGPSPRVAITTPRRLAALVRHRHRGAIVREASHGLADWNPRLSARAGWSAGQRAFGFAFGFATAAGLVAAPAATGQALCLALSALFFAMVAVRLIATAASRTAQERPPERVPDDRLPVYTVVVPLYREARVVAALVQALGRLDYPATRLDIKLILEADDLETLEAVQAEHLPDHFEILLAPAGRPQTKPRALNVALRFALGRFVAIYDAEDDPEPGQLREAVAAFAAGEATLGCVQARLVVDNARESWLARLFAIEYASLFDVINPGLARLGLPIALGGTSNHFRIEALRRVNGWDAWNVTEDVDLGIRLARFGYTVGVIASSTFEEAPYRLRPWLGQRRRWQKGWMVTLQTHSRDPARLLAQTGLRGGLAIAAVLGGTIASSLLWPLFALGVLVDAVAGPLLTPATPSERAWSALALTLVVTGTASLLWPAVLGLRRRGLTRSAAWLLLLPAYLVLLSYATWAALVEMMGRPHAWTKTEHGVSKQRTRRN